MSIWRGLGLVIEFELIGGGGIVLYGHGMGWFWSFECRSSKRRVIVFEC